MYWDFLCDNFALESAFRCHTCRDCRSPPLSAKSSPRVCSPFIYTKNIILIKNVFLENITVKYQAYNIVTPETFWIIFRSRKFKYNISYHFQDVYYYHTYISTKQLELWVLINKTFWAISKSSRWFVCPPRVKITSNREIFA